MKVSELYDGIVLTLSDEKNRAWLTNDPRINLASGERELRLVSYLMAEIVPGILLSHDDLIVYLGSENTTIGNDYTRLTRSVYVNGYTAVIRGSNFQYLEPHSSFKPLLGTKNV